MMRVRRLSVRTIKKIEPLCDVCIATFKDSVRDKTLATFIHEEVCALQSANGRIPVYHLTEENVLFYMSPIGSACAGSAVQELSYITGATKFIFFGSCGVIDECAKGELIVPSAAYRDEGFSYHYQAPSDFICIKNSDKVEAIFQNNNIPFVGGKTWTTDAFFMETQNKIAQRRKQGCVCVEMECSGVQAVCDYLGIDLYTFLFSGDLLLEKWERGNLGGEVEENKQADCFDIALCIAESVKGF